MKGFAGNCGPFFFALLPVFANSPCAAMPGKRQLRGVDAAFACSWARWVTRDASWLAIALHLRVLHCVARTLLISVLSALALVQHRDGLVWFLALPWIALPGLGYVAI
jgi:hypothetical protein